MTCPLCNRPFATPFEKMLVLSEYESLVERMATVIRAETGVDHVTAVAQAKRRIKANNNAD